MKPTDAPPPPPDSPNVRPKRRPPSNLRRLQRGASRALDGLVNGVEWWMRDPTDVVDRTPFDVIYQRDKLSVRRYQPLATDDTWQLGHSELHIPARRQGLPVLLIPPLMVQPFIFDLTRHRSLVRNLLREGFDVFLVDFGTPGPEDRTLRLDTYVLEWLPEAVTAVCQAAGTQGLSLYGYCMGGMFALMHTSVNRDSRVKAIVTIGSPVDAHKMGVVSWLVRIGHPQIEYLSKKLGNIPGPISSTAFKLTSPMRSLTRYSDLFLNLWNDDYVKSFDAVSAWTGNFIDYPGEAFLQVLGDFMKDNKLKDGKMTFGGEAADLSWITCPILSFAGKTDKVVSARAVREVMKVIGSEDKTFVEAPGGHMGVFAGRDAPRLVWAVSAKWLAERA